MKLSLRVFAWIMLAFMLLSSFIMCFNVNFWLGIFAAIVAIVCCTTVALMPGTDEQYVINIEKEEDKTDE